MAYNVRVMENGVCDVSVDELLLNISAQDFRDHLTESFNAYALHFTQDKVTGGWIIDCEEANSYMVFSTDGDYTDLLALKAEAEANDGDLVNEDEDGADQDSDAD